MEILGLVELKRKTTNTSCQLSRWYKGKADEETGYEKGLIVDDMVSPEGRAGGENPLKLPSKEVSFPKAREYKVWLFFKRNQHYL